jgi:HEAT repeat protein
MNRIVISAALVATISAGAVAQEIVWLETRFHRVHLRNGNFLDGKLLQMTEKDVILQLGPGQMNVRRDTVDRIEFMKVRSVWEKPKLDPPLVKKEPSETPKAASRPKAASPMQPLDVSPSLEKNTRAILDRMKIANREQKDALVEHLAQLGDNAAPYLCSLIETASEDIRERLMAAVMKMNDPAALSVAARLLDSGENSVRIRAIRIIAAGGDIEYARHLRALVDDENAAVRSSSIDALQNLGDVDSFDAVATSVVDADPGVRLSSVTAVLELGRKSGQMMRAVEVLGDGLYRNSQPKVLLDLLAGLGRTGHKEAWRSLVTQLSHSDPKVRAMAASALANCMSPEALPSVIERMTEEQDKSVRVNLAVAARNSRSQTAVPTLIDWLMSQDRDIQDAALQALVALTKQKLPLEYSAWKEWWDQANR